MEFKKKSLFHINKMNRTSVCMFLTFFSSAGFASMSAMTANTIQGSAPYFELNNAPIDSSLDLLGFYYKDVNDETKYSTVETAIQNQEIIVNDAMKVSELKALVPINGISTSLSSIVKDSNSNLTIMDENGDSDLQRIDAQGKLVATLYKDGVAQTSLTDTAFDLCSSYTLTIGIDTSEAQSGNISALTTYGDPNIKNYAYPDSKFGSDQISSVTYKISPQSKKGNSCYANYAKPGINPTGQAYYPAGTTSWVAGSGFKVTKEYENFPTVGFNNAYFQLYFNSDIAQNVKNNSSLTVEGSNISLQLDVISSKILQVTLKGPNSASPLANGLLTSPADAATLPTTFDLRTAENVVYTFTIKRWFVIPLSRSPDNAAVTPNYRVYVNKTYAENLCASLAPNNAYRLPDLPEITNSPYASANVNELEAPLNGNEVSNHLRRIVDGSLLGEWGSFTKNAYANTNITGIGTVSRQALPSKGVYSAHTDLGLIKTNSFNSGTGVTLCISNN